MPTNPTSCACRLPHGKISLTPLDDCNLNLVLSFSNDLRLETAGNQFSGRPLEFVQGSKVFNYISLCEMKSPLDAQKFYFIQRRLDTKFENSKLGGVRCKNFTEICIKSLNVCLISCDPYSMGSSIAPSSQSCKIHALYSLLAVLFSYIVTDLSTFCTW